MKIQTRSILAQQAATRWAEHYSHKNVQPRQRVITEKLAALSALSAPVDPDQIDAIIGNTSWTRPDNCSECGAETDMVIEIGEEPDYESATAWVCVSCLKKALALAESIMADQAQVRRAEGDIQQQAGNV